MERQNVVVILTDQLRKDFLPAYGCEAIDTPNIDLLAREGVVFDECITQSTVCAPARASMMTGRYVSDHQVWTNDVPFREGLEYIAEMMNQEGYRTGAFGKLHHTPGLDGKGFQSIRLMEENRLKEEDHYYQYLKKRHPEVTGIFNVTNNQFDYEIEDYYEHFIASEAIEFIKRAQDKPFFAWISFQGPHHPNDPPKHRKGCVDKEKLPLPIVRPNDDLSENATYRSVTREFPKEIEEIMDSRVTYSEMIVEIDAQIGRIMDRLKEEGVYEKTTIIFSSDHGDLLGDMKLSQKGPYLYEGQLAIPMIISNHPSISKNSRSNCLVGNIDIPGTVLDIAQSNKSIGYSKSLLKLLSGELTRDVNFSQFCDAIKTVEDHQYRFAYCPFDGYTELYNKKEDPMEINNLSGKEKYSKVENKFLKEIIDFEIIARGVYIETHDLVPKKQAGLKDKYPNVLNDIPIAFPLESMKVYNFLNEASLDPEYNSFCKDKEILASYTRYWDESISQDKV